MSHITNLLLVTSGTLRDVKAVGRVNEWCRENDQRAQQFEKLNTEAAGGNKVFCPDVWAMAGNYFPWHDLVEALPTFGWDFPEDVILIASGNTHDETTIYRVKP